MFLFNKLSPYFLALFVLIFPEGYAQNCGHTLSGIVSDEATGEPIAYATIYSKELNSGAITDAKGLFKISPLCKGEYHLAISHIGCDTREIYLSVMGDTTITILMDHNSHLLHEVDISAEAGKSGTQEDATLNKTNISQNADKNLANMLEGISGVSTIRNGNGIAKPVVQGLFGNRLMILNNGIAQSGQQWGVDHSPEIDPLVANSIKVIKGVGAIEYQGNSLGSVVLVEPGEIEREPHLHGKASYFFESNGLGNGLNVKLQQAKSGFAWRATGTLKKSGDNKTPDYYLNNTGGKEANLSLQFEKSITDKWSADLYFSSFNAELGILRGSHIGNLTDLEAALTRELPFYTEDSFSYDIGAPYQNVNHQLLKLHSRYQISEKQWVDFTYAGQFNQRKEFDVRRGGREEDPALSLEQWTYFLEGKYKNYFDSGWSLSTGIQLNHVDNANLPETGILPLIPDYISYQGGLFVLLIKDFGKTNLEFGGRYDQEERNVAAISITLPREIERYNNTYHSGSAAAGITHSFSDKLRMAFNLGYASRNPQVNELYSNGLHQGVSGIEEGDPNLKTEESVKATFSAQTKISKKLSLEALAYFQNIGNYIYLQPQDEIRLTIRGAFPVFKYEQTDASIYGTDLAATYQFAEKVNAIIKYSYLKGDDLTNDIPLVYMPSNRLYAEINYQFAKVGWFQNIEFQINNLYVFEQKNLLPSQDFSPPPAGYNLVGFKASAEKQLKKLRFNYFVRIDNLLNVAYRDYLNRQRYFADDLGINVTVGISASF